ncbi:MAG: ATP-binding protein [Mariprofundaceae bacterium]|nr:ATP-binding protein [Mariprofundaceae bacterium]
MKIWFALLFIALLWSWSKQRRYSKELRKKEQEIQQLNEEKARLQQTLSTRGQRLDVLLSSVTEVVVRVDKLGRVLGGNAQAQQLFQWGKLLPLPQAMLIFYRHHAWLKEYQQALNQLPTSPELPEMKLQQRVFKPRLVPLGEDQALLLCMDVTAYVSLQRQQKTLLANLMHDLKTPLTSLLGYARNIERFVEHKELCLEAASVIAQEAKHINHLMNSMLTLEHITQQEYETANCDLNQVLTHVWQVLQPRLSEKNINLHLPPSAKLPIIMAEADCVRIVMNIAENAVKFAPVSSAIDVVTAQQQGCTSLTITDQGCGIAEQHLERVTERFYRVDETRNQTEQGQQGHGLGLAIVQEILERDHGQLRLSNHENGGLVVRMQFKA